MKRRAPVKARKSVSSAATGGDAKQPSLRELAKATLRLRAAMLEHGIQIKDALLFDGKFRNVDAVGDAPNSKKAWYWATPDGRYAAYGHHRPDVNERWKLGGDQRFSKEELKIFRKVLRIAKRRSAAEQETAWRACRKRAQKIWDAVQPATNDHWYLQRKKVQPHGTRQGRGGDLIVPVADSDGTLHGLLFIKNRKMRPKVLLKDTHKKGCYLLIGGPITSAYGITEGFATGATLHEVLGIPIACAFDAGNIEYVADDLCRRYPRADPICFADNDTATARKTGKNPGLDAATAAARAIGARLVVPKFDMIKKSLTDFNDLARLKGPEAVRGTFANAQSYGTWPPPVVSSAPDPYTDLANAQRLVAASGRHLAYASPHGWYAYGPPWKSDSHGVNRSAGALGGLIRHEAECIRSGVASAMPTGKRQDDARQPDDMRKWAASSENRGRISATVHLAKDFLAVPGGRMDPHAHLLGFANSVLDLNTRSVRAYQPGDLVSLTLGCAYDPDAQAPRFKKFLREVFPGANAVRRFIQCAFGYALLGRQDEHILLILYGSGHNGKGALIRALMHVFGDYAIPAPPNLLVATRNEHHPVEIATLAGKRLVVHGETNKNAEFDAAKMKGLTGGDKLRGRGMYKDFFDFMPSHLLVMHTNYMLKVGDNTAGFWRRVKVVPFTEEFSSETDAGFEDTLWAEASGILNWLLEGLWAYKRDGLIVPQAIKDATQAYRLQQDELGTFLREKCLLLPEAWAPLADLYGAYLTWSKSRGGSVLTKTEFGDELVSRDCPQHRGTGGAAGRKGIRLR